MSSDNVGVSRKFIACVKSGDGQGAVDQLAEDVAIVESGSIPHEGTFTGKDGATRLLTQIGTIFGGLELTGESFHDAGDFVVARFSATFIAKDGSTRVSMPVVEHHWVRDGKITYADIYYKDPAKLAEIAS